MPQEALTLLDDTLRRVTETQSNSGLALIIVGSVLAFWTLTGSMQTLMWALNTAYDREETRGFVKQRLTAARGCPDVARSLWCSACSCSGRSSGWIGSAVGLESFVDWLWWTAQWPLLIGGLLFAFATILYLGPNVDHPRWRFVTFGTAISVVVWLLASGGFALYVSQFSSYNKAWGSLAAVIIMLTWLWISGLALLFGPRSTPKPSAVRLRRGEAAQLGAAEVCRRLSGSPYSPWTNSSQETPATGRRRGDEFRPHRRRAHGACRRSSQRFLCTRIRATASAPSNSRRTVAVRLQTRVPGYAAALSRSCKSVRCQFDLLVPPLRGSIVASDQPGAV